MISAAAKSSSYEEGREGPGRHTHPDAAPAVTDLASRAGPTVAL